MVGYAKNEKREDGGLVPPRSRNIHQRFVNVRLPLGAQVPEFPLLPLIIRSYTRWEEHAYPLPEVRCSLAASQMRTIWEHGTESSDKNTVKDMRSLSLLFASTVFERVRSPP